MPLPQTVATHYHIYTVRTSRQRSCNQRVGYLLCCVVRISEGIVHAQVLWAWVICCGQDGSRAQVPHRNVTYNNNSKSRALAIKYFDLKNIKL